MKILFILFGFLPLMVFSQYSETIVTDRPGQANAPYTLGKQVIQIQSGYNYNRVNAFQTNNTINGFSNVLRLGIWERAGGEMAEHAER